LFAALFQISCHSSRQNLEVQGLNSDGGNFKLITGRQRAALGCGVGPLIVWNVDVTGNPAEFDYFAIFYEACVVFDNFEHQIQFNSKAIEGFRS